MDDIEVYFINGDRGLSTAPVILKRDKPFRHFGRRPVEGGRHFVSRKPLAQSKLPILPCRGGSCIVQMHAPAEVSVAAMFLNSLERILRQSKESLNNRCSGYSFIRVEPAADDARFGSERIGRFVGPSVRWQFHHLSSSTFESLSPRMSLAPFDSPTNFILSPTDHCT